MFCEYSVPLCVKPNTPGVEKKKTVQLGSLVGCNWSIRSLGVTSKIFYTAIEAHCMLARYAAEILEMVKIHLYHTTGLEKTQH